MTAADQHALLGHFKIVCRHCDAVMRCCSAGDSYTLRDGTCNKCLHDIHGVPNIERISDDQQIKIDASASPNSNPQSSSPYLGHGAPVPRSRISNGGS